MPNSARKITRSRTGCIECKAHRQKCTEEKPACERCVRNERVCVYPPAKLEFVMHNPRRHRDARAVAPSPCHSSPPDDACATIQRPPRAEAPEMILSFQYYLERAIPTFKNTPSAFELDLWHCEGATRLRNATPVMGFFMGAYASLHQASWSRDPSPLATPAFYFDSVGKGLAQLLVAMRHNHSQTAIFYGCHLLRIMESWRTGCVANSKSHLLGMRNLLTDMETRPAATSTVPFIQMVKMYTEEHLKMLDACMTSTRDARNFAMPFSSLAMAIKSLHSTLVFWVVPLLCMNKSGWVALPDRTLVTNMLEIWRASFEPFLQAAAPALRNQHVEQMLWLHWTIATICLALDRDRPAPSTMDAQFLSIAHLLQTLSPETLRVSSAEHELFSSIPAALVVLVYCRHPGVRRIVLAHLEQHEQTEGVWNSRIAWHAAATAMAVEDCVRAERNHSNYLVLPERAYCQLAPDHSAASINFTFCIQQANALPQFRSQRVTLTSPGDIAACARTDWPLEPILRTFGYLFDNVFSSTALMTPHILRDGALMRRRLEAAAVCSTSPDSCSSEATSPSGSPPSNG